ncbi:hypothetical protein AC52_1801 [Escherichia coli 5-366-08_S3_C3]|nr:hypothetical protein AB72_0282 [Escherichia coli 1-250-04_S1_C3]KDX25113.1 hypothetical protein AB13_4783 [Escherichia coli 1-250-04_S1_C1]KDX26601.1 hypothetical protein AB41_3897 [Escherichia coli 1-250-04_S1_C2]KEL75681.1 hypothetical protein AC52_1801 [Escherichia coli 5-366-08_S3_C3]KEL94157.1 hypothetical protein AB94_1857 [Escherichia coli 5-366-08_S3_C1]
MQTMKPKGLSTDSFLQKGDYTVISGAERGTHFLEIEFLLEFIVNL